MGTTITELLSLGVKKVMVTSDNDAILTEACKHNAIAKKILLSPNGSPKEKYLPPGTLRSLHSLKEYPKDVTMVLWHSTPWINKELLALCYNCDWKDSIQMYTTIRESRNNPCQFFEGIKLKKVVIFVPVSENSSDAGHLVSHPFPFDWRSRPHDMSGTHFTRMVNDDILTYQASALIKEQIPREGLWEKLDESHARLFVPAPKSYKRSATNSILTPWAIQLGGYEQERFEILRDDDTGEVFLTLPAYDQISYDDYSIKIWVIEKKSMQPWMLNGITLGSEKYETISALEDQKEKTAIALAGIPKNCSLLVWFTQNLTNNNEINSQLAWVPEQGGWYLNHSSQTALSGTEQVISGRQDFPKIFEPDKQATLFAPGFLPKNEPGLENSMVRGLNTDNLFPRPIMTPLDIFRARYFLALNTTHQTDLKSCQTESML